MTQVTYFKKQYYYPNASVNFRLLSKPTI